MIERSIASFLCLAAVLAVSGRAGGFRNCGVDRYGATNGVDVQALISEALGGDSPDNDLNKDGRVNIVDIRIVLHAALGEACVADPHFTSIVPNAGRQGASGINATVSAVFTSFTDNNVVDLGDGIAITNVAAADAATLTATLAIAAVATAGASTLTVDGLSLANAFTVSPPVSVSYTYDSQGRLSTAAYVLASGGTTIVTYTYGAAGNRAAVVAQ